MDQLTHPWRWKRPCNDYYYREYEFGSTEWDRVVCLIRDHFGCGNVRPPRILAVYNPALTVSFINMWNVYMTRMKDSPELFFTRSYKKNQQKLWVNEHYEMVCAKCSWNQQLSVPLAPALHGMASSF
jgi:hypothetical protein